MAIDPEKENKITQGYSKEWSCTYMRYAITEGPLAICICFLSTEFSNHISCLTLNPAWGGWTPGWHAAEPRTEDIAGGGGGDQR